MVMATPWMLPYGTTGSNTSTVKMPDTNIVNYQEAGLPQEMITDLLYEDIGGGELINISRHDIIDGTPVTYTVISNLSDINTMFNSTNIIPGFETRDTYLNQYSLDIGQRINEVGFDDDGSLVIDFGEIGLDENVEVHILVNGIIYVI